MAADKMLRKSFPEFQDIAHYLVADVFNPWFKFILLFHF